MRNCKKSCGAAEYKRLPFNVSKMEGPASAGADLRAAVGTDLGVERGVDDEAQKLRAAPKESFYVVLIELVVLQLVWTALLLLKTTNGESALWLITIFVVCAVNLAVLVLVGASALAQRHVVLATLSVCSVPVLVLQATVLVLLFLCSIAVFWEEDSAVRSWVNGMLLSPAYIYAESEISLQLQLIGLIVLFAGTVLAALYCVAASAAWLRRTRHCSADFGLCARQHFFVCAVFADNVSRLVQTVCPEVSCRFAPNERPLPMDSAFMYEHCVLLVFVWALDVTVLGRCGVLQQVLAAARQGTDSKADLAAMQGKSVVEQEQLRRCVLLVLGSRGLQLSALTVYAFAYMELYFPLLSSYLVFALCLAVVCTAASDYYTVQATLHKPGTDAAALDASVYAQDGSIRRPRYDSRPNVRLRAINWVGSTEELGTAGMGSMRGIGMGSLRMGSQAGSGRQAGSSLPGRTLGLKKQQ